VYVLNGLSAHADQTDLVAFATQTAGRGNLRTVALVHGEPGPRETLAEALQNAGIQNVVQGRIGAQLDLP
jgi:metallo-beta-lactamase family protein